MQEISPCIQRAAEDLAAERVMVIKTKRFFFPLLTAVLLFVCYVDGRCQTYEEIIPEEAHYMIKTHSGNPGLVVLDVRTPEEFSRGHIEGAVNIDIRDENFQERVESLPREKTYIIYCRTSERSERAFTIFKELGFSRVYHMLWGVVGWKEAGLPLVNEP